MMSDTLVIAEANPNDGAAGNEFIVLYNATGNTVTLPAGFRLRWTNGTARAINNAYTSDIAPFGYYKVARPITTSDSDAYFGTATGEATLAAGAAAISWDGTTWFDKVAYGTYVGADSEPPINTSSITSGRSVVRKPLDLVGGGAGIDTGVNAGDFTYNVTPKISRNRLSPPERLVFTLSAPASVIQGTAFTLECTAVVNQNHATISDSKIAAYGGPLAWGNLSVPGGFAITPDTSGAFTTGSRSCSVTITSGTGSCTILIADAYSTGSIVVTVNSLLPTPNAPIRLSPAISHETDTPRPGFAWTHNDTTGNPQAKFHLQLSTSQTFATILYEETTTSSNTSAILASRIADPAESTIYWRVRTSNAGDSFSAFQVGDSTFLLHLHVPNAPTLTNPAAATETTSRTMRFTWTHSDVDGSAQETYVIEFYRDSAATSLWGRETGVTANAFYDTTFPATNSDSFLFWRVRTGDKVGFGAFCDTRALTLKDTTPRLYITEVAMNRGNNGADSDFIEVYCADDRAGGAGANLSGWNFLVNGASEKTLGSVTVHTGSFLVLSWYVGQTDEASDAGDSVAMVFAAADEGAGGLTNSNRAIALQAPGSSDRDAVVFGSATAAFTGATQTEVNRLVAAGQWSGASDSVGTNGQTGVDTTIQRDTGLADSNAPADWFRARSSMSAFTADHFVVTSDSATPGANETFTITVRAVDHLGRRVYGWRGEASVGVDLGNVSKSAVTFSTGLTGDSGIHRESVALSVSGARTITLRDSFVVGSVGVTVQPGAIDHFTLSLQDPNLLVASRTVRRGTPFNLRVVARDASAETKTDYTGTVSLTVANGTISPTSFVFQSGWNGDTTVVATISGLGAAGQDTITAADGGANGMTVAIPLTDNRLVVNEVYPTDITSTERDEWFEIYNRSTATVSTAGWSATDYDGPSNNFNVNLAAVSIPSGKYAVVHTSETYVSDDVDFADTDGAAHIFPLSTWFNRLVVSGDPVALYASTTQDSTTIVSFVAYAASVVDDDSHAVDAGLWTNNQFVTFTGTQDGRSIFRTSEGRDTYMSPTDWGVIPTTETYTFTEGFANNLFDTDLTGVAISLRSASGSIDTALAGETILVTLTATGGGNASLAGVTTVYIRSLTDETGIVVTLKESAVASRVYNQEIRSFTADETRSMDGKRWIGVSVNDTITASWVRGGADALTIVPAPLDHFDLSTPASVSNDFSFYLTISARTATGALKSDYTGTVNFSIASGSMTPTSVVFAASDSGSKQVSVTLSSAALGTDTITGTAATEGDTGRVAFEVVDAPSVVINEIMPFPSVVDWDASGSVDVNQDEWIEIFNRTSSAIGLASWKLGETSVSRVTLSDTIEARGYLVVYRKGSGTAEGYFFDSAGVFLRRVAPIGAGALGPLTNSGGRVTLTNAASVYIDDVTYPSTSGDSSYLRAWDGNGVFRSNARPTGGETPALPAAWRETSANMRFRVVLPDTASQGESFTLQVVALGGGGETVTSFSGSASVTSSGGPTLSRSTLAFTNGIFYDSAYFATTTGTATIVVTYETNTWGRDTCVVSVSAGPALSLTKIIRSTTIGGSPSAPVPGSTVEYQLAYANAGGTADSVIIRDSIPVNAYLDTASRQSDTLGASATFDDTTDINGWRIQHATVPSPDQSYTSADYTSGLPADRTTVRWIRWIRRTVLPAESATIRFRVILQ